MPTEQTAINRIAKSGATFAKFLTSVFSYLCLAIASVVVIGLAHKRGNPSILIVLYYFALVLNIGQITVAIVNFVLQKTGHYNRFMRIIENAITLTWGGLLFLQFVVACVLFEAFRLDSFLIVLVETCTIALMLLYHRRIEHKVNTRFNQRMIKQGVDARDADFAKKRDVAKIILYSFVALLIFAIQFTIFVFPTIPPKIDDMFAPNRVLEYSYYSNKDGYVDGYYVSGMYYGLNDSIVVPATYNNKPVVGILSGAIRDLGKINSLQIGEYDQNGKLVSNVQLIESRAIELDNINTISLPSSLQNLQSNALQCDNLQTVNYYSASGFEADAIQSNKLATVNLFYEDAVIDVDFENLYASVNVPNNLYNDYRERYYYSRHDFALLQKEGYIVVDFEADCDYYLDSKILDANNARLNITALKNDGEETSYLINDTAVYNKDNYASEGFEAKYGYAFRGWYRDANFTKGLECVFDEQSFVTFTENTTVYAKWNELKTVTLDWSNYYPYNEKTTTIQYVDTQDELEAIQFPQFVPFEDYNDSLVNKVTRVGYVALNWKYNSQNYVDTCELFGIEGKNITLKAEWILETPIVTYSTFVNGDYSDGCNIDISFDESNEIIYTATIKHNAPNVTLVCNWSKQTNGIYVPIKSITTNNNDIFQNSFYDCNDSGQYQLEVVAQSSTGEVSSSFQQFLINISPKQLDMSGYAEMTPVTVQYNGNAQQLSYTHSLPGDISVTTYYKIGNQYGLVAPTNAQIGQYDVKYVFENIGQEKDNYLPDYKYSSITIQPKPVTANWAQSGSEWDENFEVTYDGNYHLLTPEVVGICNDDSVDFVLNNTAKKDAGEYKSTIIGIDNANYTLDNDNIELEHTWTINKKTVTASFVNTTASYLGRDIQFQLRLYGVLTADISTFSLDNYSYVTSCGVQLVNNGLTFVCKNAGSYNVNLSAINHTNYQLNTSVSQQLNITPAKLSAVWSNTSVVYNSSSQQAILTISGFKNDGTTAEQLLKQLEVNDVASLQSFDAQSGELTIAFSKINAGNYTLDIDGINNANYDFNGTTTNFNIDKKPIQLTQSANSFTYNGQYRTVLLTIEGYYPTDIDVFKYNPLKYTNNNCTDVIYNAQTTSLELKAVNADNYSASVSGLVDSLSNSNYQLVQSSIKQYSFDIVPATVNFEWSTSNFTYNGLQQTVTATITSNVYNNVLNAGVKDSITLNYLNNQKTDVGDYSAVVSIDNSNYAVDNVTNINQWQIEQKDIIVTNNATTFTYDGKYKYFDIVYSGFVQSELNSITSQQFVYSYNGAQIEQHSCSVVNDTIVARFRAIDAGHYQINLLSTTLGNYNITVDKQFDIAQAQIQFTWDYEGGFIYNKSTYKVSPIFTNLYTREDNSQQDTTDYVVQNGSKINAGTYTAELVSVTNDNYFVGDNNSLQWSIQKRELVLSWGQQTFIFNASHQQNTVTASNLCSGDSLTYVYKFYSTNHLPIDETINKGSYIAEVVSLTGNSASNYKLPDTMVNAEYDILPCTLTLSVTNTDGIYKGSLHNGVKVVFSGFPTYQEAYSFSSTDFVISGDISSATKSSNSTSSCTFNIGATNVGLYEVNLVSSRDPNYQFEESSTQFNITPRVIEIDWGTTVSTYDGNNKTFEADIVNKVSGDVINITYSFDGTSYTGNKLTTNTTSQAGVYTVKIVSIDNDNYTIQGLSSQLGDGELAQQFTINRKAITVNCSNSTLTYNGQYQGVTLYISGYVSKDSSLFQTNPLVFTHNGVVENNKYVSGYTTSTLKLTAVNAGTYDIAVTNLISTFDNSNYYLAESAKINTSYTINKARISVEWNSSSLVYNGQTQTVLAEITSDIYTNALTGKDSITLSYSNNSKVDCGTYTASLTDISNINYQLPTTLTHKWTIGQKQLSTQWNTQAYTYDGKYKTASLTISGFVNKDIVDKTLSDFTSSGTSMTVSTLTKGETTITLNFQQIDAGSYYYYLTAIADDNYTLSATKNYLVINKREIGLDWSASSFTYDGTTHSVTCDATNLAVRADTGVSDVITINLSNNSSVQAGDFVARANSLAGTYSSNYMLPDITSKEWSIKAVALTTQWIDGDNIGNSGSFSYDGLQHTISLEISGFVGTEYSDVLSSSFSSSTTINKLRAEDGKVYLDFYVTNAKVYSLNVSKFSNTNYTFVSTSKTVQIAPAQLAVSWSSENSFVYNGNANNVVAYISGFVNGEEDSTGLSKFVYSSSSITPSLTTTSGVVMLTFGYRNVGNYTTQISNYLGSNYDLVPSSNNIEITAKALTTSWNGPYQFEYDGSLQGITLRISEVASVDLTNFVNYLTLMENVQKVQSNHDTNSITITFKAKNAGNYSITVKPNALLSNYSLSTTSKSFNIAPKTLTASWTTDSATNSQIYDGANHTVTLTLQGFVDGENKLFNSDDFTCTQRAINSVDTQTAGAIKLIFNTLKDADTYTLTVREYLSNYDFEDEVQYVYTIKPMTLTYNWQGANSMQYNATKQGLTLNINGIVEEDVDKVKNALIVSGSDYSVTYDDTLAVYCYAINCGTYTLSVSINGLDNYIFEGTSNTFEITQTTLMTSWSSSTTYNSAVYDGKEKSVTLTITGIPTSVKLTEDMFNIYGEIASYDNSIDGQLIVNFIAVKNVGTYNYRIDGVNSDNYSINESSYTYNITPRALSTQWATSTLNSSDVYDGTEKIITLSISGVVSGDIFETGDFVVSGGHLVSCQQKDDNYILQFVGVKNVGTYTFAVSAVLDSNYSLQVTNYTYEITAKTLSISYNGEQSVEYDNNSHYRTVVISGFVGDDLQADVIANILYQLTQNAQIEFEIQDGNLIIKYGAVNAGSYSLQIIDVLVHNNYFAINVNDNLNINKRIITVEQESIVTGDLQFSNLVDSTQLTEQDYAIKVYKDQLLTEEVTEWTDEGTYYYVITLIDLPNYTLANAQGSFVVKGDVMYEN